MVMVNYLVVEPALTNQQSSRIIEKSLLQTLPIHLCQSSQHGRTYNVTLVLEQG